jgi:hypothetical protein
MVTFFRQRRQTMMERNALRSYLPYAVGEIVLVMIGILLGRQEVAGLGRDDAPGSGCGSDKLSVTASLFEA